MKPKNRKEIFLNALAKGQPVGIEPLTRDEKYLAQQAERESKGAGGVTSWNDLPDRPFGEETVDKAFIDGSLSLEEDGVGSCYGTIAPAGEIIPITEGMAVRVEGVIADAFDGGYSNPENFSTDTTATGPYIRFQTENYGEISIQVSGNRYLISTSLDYGSFSVTIKVTTALTEITPIPTKYLPEGIGGDGVFIVTLDALNLSADKTYEEIVAAQESGKAVFARVNYPDQTGHGALLPITWIKSSDNKVFFSGIFAGDDLTGDYGYVLHGSVSAAGQALYMYNVIHYDAPT